MTMTGPNPTSSRADFPQFQVTPPTKRRRWPWILVGVVGTFVVLGGGCAALIGGAAKQVADSAAKQAEVAAEGGVSNGIGSQDAAADVGTPTMAAPDAIGIVYVQLPVTNHSSGRSDYFIDVAIESADGATQLGTTSAFVQGLEAGQSTTAEAMVADAGSLPADAVIRITAVQRTASI
jgi:hypothetical protein